MDSEDFYIEFRKLHPKPYFNFPEISFTNELSFEKLGLGNFEQLYLLFEQDTSPFVDTLFKSYEEAKQYAKYISFCGTYSPKHGCQDWLFKWHNQYAGVLHLYDLSLETFGQNNRRAWIGFATTEPFRNKQITSKALAHFVHYIFNSYPAINFIHSMVLKENNAAISFLKRNGFQADPEERLSKLHRFFILSRPELS